MRIDDQLEQEARDVAARLRAHADDFAGVHVVRVDPAIDIDDQGDPFISPTIVLSDPEEHEMWVYTHRLSVSDEAAA